MNILTLKLRIVPCLLYMAFLAPTSVLARPALVGGLSEVDLQLRKNLKTSHIEHQSSQSDQQLLSQGASAADQFFERGTTAYRNRHLAVAIKFWQKALTFYHQQRNAQREGITLSFLGLATQDLGKHQEAIRFFTQALPLIKQGSDQAAQASILGNLGKNYSQTGQYAQAISHYDQSLALWHATRNQENAGIALRGLGNVYITLGNYEKALKYHQQGLTIAKHFGSAEALANSYNSIGVIETSLGHYAKASQILQQSLTASQTVTNPRTKQFLQAQALSNLGNAELSLKNYPKSLDYYQQSLSIAQTLKDQRQESLALQGLGSVHTVLKNHVDAVSYLQKSLAIAKQVNDGFLKAKIMHGLGANLRELGRLQEAEQYFNTAVTLLDKLRQGLADIDQVSIFETQVHSYALLRRVLAEQNKVDLALEASERGRARAFVELLTKRAANRDKSGNRINQYAQLPNLQKIRQAAQQQNATLVEYAYVADEEFVAQGKIFGDFIKIYIWVVQPNGNITLREVNLTPAQTQLLKQAGKWANGWTKSFQPQEKALRKAIRSEFKQIHKDLYDILIAPISDLLPTDPTSPIIFIPYRELFQVSFPALQAPDGSYLIQNHTILTAPSIQVLELTHQQQSVHGTSKNALVVGNPTMPSKTAGESPMRQLPGSAGEAQNISQILNTQALIGNSATETTIKQRIGSAQIIHLATHGLLDDFNQSGVPGAIALAPDAHNDGLLTSDEILDLELSADLVVVSACDTGRGHLTGDGVVGLSRSIMAAGVPNVIVTLWAALDDQSTPMLMNEFHTQYSKQPNAAQALRQAMLTTMQNHPHPVNWSLFTLVGKAQ